MQDDACDAKLFFISWVHCFIIKKAVWARYVLIIRALRVVSVDCRTGGLLGEWLRISKLFFQIIFNFV